MATVTISKSEFDEAFRFAHRVLGTLKYYQSRNQNDKNIILAQTIAGKVGEYGARRWLQESGVKLSNVDVMVYGAGKKSFSADLVTINGVKIHVKSQVPQAAFQFGLSWTFGWGGTNGSVGHRDKEVFDDYGPDDRVVCCLVKWMTVDIKAEIPVRVLHQRNLFKDPKKPELQGIKKVLYYSDIPYSYRILPTKSLVERWR